MKFSYSWIAELVPGLTVEPKELERLITMKTAECEGVEAVGAHFAKVQAARVVAIEPLPKGRNQKVRIELDGGKETTVVCGAPNVRPGMIAPWVPPGTALGSKAIGRAVIEGVESEGMLASSAELGISRDGAGLLELETLAAGALLPGLEPDWIIEIDNKSLTHRPDLWGHYGMAREVAAITGHELIDPVHMGELPEGDAPIRVEIADYELCPRYSALAFDNVEVKAAPLWLRARLEHVGLNAINNLVDVTNYVLAELPQPMHAFDRDKLAGDTIYVRRARTGERLAALNGQTYELTEADLVIADASGPVALAGVIGGAHSAISTTTQRIVLESANFQAASVRLTSARHKLRTDASMRFEKSLDPENTLRGLARARELLRRSLPAIRPVGGAADNRGPVRTAAPILLPIEFVTKKLGKHLEREQISGILRALGFGVSASSAETLTVTVPSWRATKDISGKADLLEEVGRMVGYGEITPAAPIVAAVVPPQNPMRLFLRELRRRMAGQGFSEVYNYSFVTAEDIARFGWQASDHIGVRNPIASELTHLRRSLLPGIFKNLLSNVRHFREFRLFEIGNEIHARTDGALPDEKVHLAALLYDAHGDVQMFFELKRVLGCAFSNVQLRAADEVYAYEHPARTAIVLQQATYIGRLFELHPSLLAREGVEGRAVVFDIDLGASLELLQKSVFRYEAPRRYPTSGFDLSIVTETRKPVADLRSELLKLAGDHAASVEFIRQYEGPPLADREKSVSYHLEIGARDHTLTTDERTAIIDGIVRGLRGAGYEIRGLDAAEPSA